MLRIVLQLGILLILLAGTGDVVSAADGDKELEWGKEVEGVRFGIAPLSPSFRYDQPVILHMTVKNFQKVEIHISSGPYMGIYLFDVRLPNGKPAPLTLEGTRQKNDRVFNVSTSNLAPGESHTERIMLNRYYDMTMLGEYTITIQRHVQRPGRGAGGSPSAG